MKKRINRNTKESIKTDIKHLKEMVETLEKAPTDGVSYSHLKSLIEDWKDELEETV